MWPSDSGNSHSHKNGHRQSASSSSPSSVLPKSPRRKTTMEEVWKDINLATLGHKSTAGRHTVRGVILQDFLAGAYKDPPSSAAAEQLHLPLPPTALTLSSPAGFHYPCFRPAPPNSNFPLHVTVGSSSPSSVSAGDRRHKRVMKNRESAARSRARKQAYTNELELEAAQLAEENAKLRKENEEVFIYN